MLGNIGDLFVKCMRQVTKGHLYHLLGVSDYYVMYRFLKKHLATKVIHNNTDIIVIITTPCIYPDLQCLKGVNIEG